MIDKIYEVIKKIMANNYKFILTWAIILFLLFFKLPYYIVTPGGIMPVSERFEIAGYGSGSTPFQITYVTELDATIPAFLLATIFPTWDIVKKEEIVASNETEEESLLRNRLSLQEGNHNAVIVAYEAAGKKAEITNSKAIVTYIDEMAQTDFKIGDEIIAVENIPIDSTNDFSKQINLYEKGQRVSFTVLSKGTEVSRYGVVQEIEGIKLIGLLIMNERELLVDPEIKFSFRQNESGASGGLMMSLAIYSTLTDNKWNITDKIAGTGTIDSEGNVGEISGVPYKILGSAKKGIKTFFIPREVNYEEALEVVKKHNLDIEIVPISTFEEAIRYLNNLE